MAHSLFKVGLWNQKSGYYVKQFFLALHKVAPKEGTNLGAPIESYIPYLALIDFLQLHDHGSSISYLRTFLHAISCSSLIIKLHYDVEELLLLHIKLEDHPKCKREEG
jgi:hypothetical protein